MTMQRISYNLYFAALLRICSAMLVACSVFIALPSFAQNQQDFIQAIKLDQAYGVQQWLASGGDPNLVDKDSNSALMQAIRQESFAAALALLKSPKLNLDARNSVGETALMLAALKGRLDVVEILLQKGAQVNQNGWSALHYAATGGNVQIIQLLLKKSASINALSPNGTTPLMMAAGYGGPDSVALLLQAKADTNLKNEAGLTALDFARRANNDKGVQMLEKTTSQ